MGTGEKNQFPEIWQF